MALKHGTVNPLAVAGMRRLEFLPPHFAKLPFDLKANERTVSDWIYENLDGRFYLGQGVNNDGVGLCEVAAFENHSELTYFSLILNTINVYTSY